MSAVPRIVYGSISGYGDVGPLAGRGGFDLILQAASGLMSVTGHPDTGPAKVGAPVLDVGSGLACVVGMLAALVERSSGGQGRHVDTSLLEFSLSSLSTIVTDYFVSGRAARAARHALADVRALRVLPRCRWLAGLRRSRVGRVVGPSLCVLGREDLLDDPRLRDNGARVRHRDELTTAIEKTALAHRPVGEWLERFDAAGFRRSASATSNRAFDNSQVEALEVVQQLDDPAAGTYRTVGVPFRLDGNRPRLPRPAPRLGSSTAGRARRGRPQRAEDRRTARRRRGRRGVVSESGTVGSRVLARTLELCRARRPRSPRPSGRPRGGGVVDGRWALEVRG